MIIFDNNCIQVILTPHLELGEEGEAVRVGLADGELVQQGAVRAKQAAQGFSSVSVVCPWMMYLRVGPYSLAKLQSSTSCTTGSSSSTSSSNSSSSSNLNNRTELFLLM